MGAAWREMGCPAAVPSVTVGGTIERQAAFGARWGVGR